MADIQEIETRKDIEWRASVSPRSRHRNQIGSGRKMLTQAKAEAFASEWIEAWNSHDLDRVLAHYSDDIEFSSPLVAQIAVEPSGRLRGKNPVKAYWATALARIHDLRFKLVSVHWGVGSIVIHYESRDGRLASEWFEFGENGEVIRSAAHYSS